jgi:hypothetical protein
VLGTTPANDIVTAVCYGCATSVAIRTAAAVLACPTDLLLGAGCAIAEITGTDTTAAAIRTTMATAVTNKYCGTCMIGYGKRPTTQ